MGLSPCGSVVTDRQGRELIEHGTPLFPAACYHDNISEANVSWRRHDELEALAVETGAARVAANGRDCVVKQGEGPEGDGAADGNGPDNFEHWPGVAAFVR